MSNDDDNLMGSSMIIFGSCALLCKMMAGRLISVSIFLVNNYRFHTCNTILLGINHIILFITVYYAMKINKTDNDVTKISEVAVKMLHFD